jgi:membrane protease subunit HflC
MKLSVNTLAALAALVAMLAYGSLYTVGERELAIKFRFSEIIDADIAPGLHAKFPFINSVSKYPKRLLTINNPQEKFLTSEKKNLYVDFFVKWRVHDVAEYYRSTGGDPNNAARRLLEIVRDGIRAEFAKRTVREVVSAERREMMAVMMSRARAGARELGIEMVDVRVKKIEFPDEVSNSVFRRMREERFREAAKNRAEGAETAELIRASADRQRTVILAEAYRDSEIIRGEGDALATEIYAGAYNRNPEFYSFSRSIEAYKKSLGTDRDVLVLDADSDFLRYLNNSRGKN